MLLCALAVIAICTAIPSAQADVVRTLDSTVIVRQDGTLEVDEIMTVVVSWDWNEVPFGRYIERAPGGWGDIAVLEVTRDGIPEDWRLEGDAILSTTEYEDLNKSNYVYRFRYVVPHQIEHLGSIDRVNWFATGSRAIASINSATATFIFAPDVRVQAAGIGLQNISPANVDVQLGEDGSQRLTFRTANVIQINEVFPIFIDVAPGFFLPPDPGAERLWRLFRSNVPSGLAAILIVPAFYVLYFLRGYPKRSQAARTRRLTPAALRFLERRRFDATALLAAILSLVSRGHATLLVTEAGPFVEPALGRQQAQLPADEEIKVYDRLFHKGEVGVSLSGNADQRLVDAAIVLKSELEARWMRRSRLDRRTWLAIGHGIAVLGVLLVGATSAGPHYGLLIGGGVVLWTTGLALFVWFNVAIFRALRRGERGLGRIVAFFVPPVTLWVAYQADRLLGESWALLGLGGFVPIILSFGFTLLSFVILHPRIDCDAAVQQEIGNIRNRIETRNAVRRLARGTNTRMPLAVDPLLPYAVALGAHHAGFEAIFDAMRGVAGVSQEVVRWQSGHNIDGQMPGFGIAFYEEPPPPR
jgi:hypothetical protein